MQTSAYRSAVVVSMKYTIKGNQEAKLTQYSTIIRPGRYQFIRIFLSKDDQYCNWANRPTGVAALKIKEVIAK